MKSMLTGLIVGGVLTSHLLAQQPPGGRFGPSGFGDPARRLEMMVDRLAEDVGLDRAQQRELQDLFVKVQTSAKPLQDELQTTRKAIKDAIKTGKRPDELDALHQQTGAAYAKLAAIQSAAFADALKILKDDQRANADVLFEPLGMIAGSGIRGGMPMRGGPGGPGPDGSRVAPPGAHGASPGSPDQHPSPPKH